MANKPVELQIDGFKPREVAAVTYSFNQSTDMKNQPSGVPLGGKIIVRVKAEDDGNVELLNWMTDDSLVKKGHIVFMVPSDLNKKMKSIDFEGAYCVNFEEHWEGKINPNDNTIAHWEEITISCRKIVNGPVTYENEGWGK